MRFFDFLTAATPRRNPPEGLVPGRDSTQGEAHGASRVRAISSQHQRPVQGVGRTGMRRRPKWPGAGSKRPARARPQLGAAALGRRAGSRAARTSRARSGPRRSRRSRWCRPRGRGRCRCRRSAAPRAGPCRRARAQRRRRRGRHVEHLEVGVEGGEVQRHVRARACSAIHSRQLRRPPRPSRCGRG